MYDEVSHRTPAVRALQLQITEFFQMAANITIAYGPLKTNTTAVQRTCKSITAARSVKFVSCATIAFRRLHQRYEIIRASITRRIHRSTLHMGSLARQAARRATTSRQICNGDVSAPTQCSLRPTPPTGSQLCMAVQRHARRPSTARQPLSNCSVDPISYPQCTVPGSCMS
jgi:hypothetical protein